MASGRTFLACVLLAVIPPGLSRAGDEGASGTPAPVAGVPPGVVDGPTAHKLVASGVKVIDVRTRSEFEAGHVPGAFNIPHDEMAKRWSEIGPPSTPVLLYCTSGRRTQVAARALRSRGFSTIYDMQSYERWRDAGKKR